MTLRQSRFLLHAISSSGDVAFFPQAFIQDGPDMDVLTDGGPFFIFPGEDVFLSGIIRFEGKILCLLSAGWQVMQLQAADAGVSGRCFPQIQSVFQGASPVRHATKSHMAVAAAFPRSGA